MVKLTTEWQVVPFADTELELMVATGKAWRSFEVVGDVVVVRYCLAHDVLETVIENDHAR